MALTPEEIKDVVSAKHHTVECLCGYIATFESIEFTYPDCGRKWQFDNKGKQMQTGLPANIVQEVEDGKDN
jgi:hypothetical protein